MIRQLFAGLVCILAIAPAAKANDTSAVLGLGGLEFVKTDDIAIEREDLFLSRREVRVRYEMRNLRAEPVTMRIAFPLPAVPVATIGGWSIGDKHGKPVAALLDVPNRYDLNLVNFSSTVNGVPVATDIEIRALLPDGRDITQALRQIGGWSLLTQPQILTEGALPTLPFAMARDVGPTIMRQLRELRAIDQTRDAGWPLWNTFITYHWQQTFPPGVKVVEHRYQPIAGWTPFLGRVKPGRRADDWAGTESTDRTYCIDEAKDQALNAIEQSAPPGGLQAYTLAYVLTTGANWAGPIREFHVTVDGADKSPRDTSIARFVSVCAEIPTKETAPMRWEGYVRNYTPTQDLRALFILGWPR